MRAILNTLVDELNRLKAAGVKEVSVSDEGLAALHQAVDKLARLNPPPKTESQPEEKSAPSPALSMPSQAPAAPVIPRSEPRKLPPPSPFTLPEGDKTVRWTWLLDRVLKDPVCLSQVRPGKKVVLGVGSLDAPIMFVGEAPGAEEEIQGEPFVGPAGQLLTKMIAATGLKRADVYIGNIMNWRPQMSLGSDGLQHGNREPSEEEMNYCLPFLRAQIEIVKPRIVVGLGATAARGLLGFHSFKTLGEIRGRWLEYCGLPLLISYHPSYLLRKESESPLSERKAKRAAWEDYLKVMEKAGLPISEKQRSYFA